MAICFDMLKAALAGGYINFGVMQLYGDDALNDALQMFVKLVMSIPQQDILVREKFPLLLCESNRFHRLPCYEKWQLEARRYDDS